MKSKKIGILGLGSRTTLFYIKELNSLYNKKNGGYSTFPFKMLNANFDSINNLLPEVSTALEAIVMNHLTALTHLGVDSIVIPNITLHQTVDSLHIVPQIIHPITLTIKEIKKQNIQKVALFGSAYTMKSSYISSLFKKEDIEIYLPTERDLLLIDEVRKRIYEQSDVEVLIDDFNLLIEKYLVECPVVLACTELSIGSNSSSTGLFDMARIQIECAVKLMD